MITIELTQQQAQTLLGVISQVPTGYELYPLFLELQEAMTENPVAFEVIKNDDNEE